jgi:hypothetical protein
MDSLDKIGQAYRRLGQEGKFTAFFGRPQLAGSLRNEDDLEGWDGSQPSVACALGGAEGERGGLGAYAGDILAAIGWHLHRANLPAGA